MSDIISRKEAIASAKSIFESDSVMKAFCMMKMLKELPSIESREAVKIIWSAQIDELIKRIMEIAPDDSSTEDVVLLDRVDVLYILQEAKK